MRLGTFNVLNGRSPADGAVDPDRFHAAVGALDCDVLALQEVDLDQPRSGGADLCALAADALGAAGSRFTATVYGTPGERWRPADGATYPAGAPRVQFDHALAAGPIPAVRAARAIATPVSDHRALVIDLAAD